MHTKKNTAITYIAHGTTSGTQQYSALMMILQSHRTLIFQCPISCASEASQAGLVSCTFQQSLFFNSQNFLLAYCDKRRDTIRWPIALGYPPSY